MRSLRFVALLAMAGCAGAPARGGAIDSHVPAPYTGAQLAAVVDITEVALSPDGNTLAFVTDRTGSFELFTVDLTVANAAPEQRTRADESVSGLAWSPRSDRLLFEMDHGGDERADLFAWTRADDRVTRVTATASAEQGVRFSPDGTRLALESDPARPFRFNVFVRDADGATRQLSNAPINVQHARWTRDGRTLVATRSGDDQRGDLLVIDVASGATREIHPPRAEGIAYAVDPLPDGRMLALATNARGFAQLAIVDLATGATVFVGPADWDIEDAEVGDDGSVLFVRNVHGESEVLFAPRGDFGATRIIAHGGVVTALSMDRSAHTAAMVREQSSHPPAIETVDLSSGVLTLRVPAHVGDVDPARLVEAQRRTFASFDGTPIDAYLWRPRVTRLGSPPPLVMHVHGGPNGQTRDAFSPTVQALAEAGFVVASVNYRGSTGYGRAFEDLNNRDWGGGDLRDIVQVIHALGREGLVDARRVGIYGGSYGGYMTLRAITATPHEWQAAVDMFGMPDLAEDYRLTADRFGTWYATEMGDPVRDAALYRDRSPIHALDRVRTPLLVLQGENDSNVPRAESDAVVAALRGRSRDVAYTVYPDEGHGFTHRAHRIDAIDRTVAFFREHLSAAHH